MEIRYITTKIPSGSEAFVFGSILNTNTPNDFDLLVIYDATICPPKEAYMRHEPLCEALSNHLKIPVHLTPLTRAEAVHARFLERTNAIPLEAAFKKLRNPAR